MITSDKKDKEDMISAKKIVKKYGITYQTINHYTNFGLFSIIARTGNVRMYKEAEIKERLKIILELVNEGYSLHLIRKKFK